MCISSKLPEGSVIWNISSSHPHRRSVFMLCDTCMLELFTGVMRLKGCGSDGSS